MSVSGRDLLVVRHGMNSDRKSMEFLADALRRTEFGGTTPDIDNESYHWKNAVMEEGIALARTVAERLYEPQRHRRIVLIGHSQGGLLCRVAAAMLSGKTSLTSLFTTVAFGPETAAHLAAWRSADRQKAELAGRALAGVIMLATPNGGAFTFGQAGVLGRLTTVGLRKLVSPFGVRDLSDLMTDRIPKVLQHYRVGRVQYLSISGSAGSRYSSLHYEDLSDLPWVGRLGARLELPNDRVVEDEAVDLAEVPLPCEIEEMAIQYEHIRTYIDCTGVSHTGIQEDPEVLRIIRDRLARWLTAPA